MKIDRTRSGVTSVSVSRYTIANVGLIYRIDGGEGKDVGEVIIFDGKGPMSANLPLG